ncbi:ribonuclease domain-containing protein [Dyella silvatica]|uniref:ribonuclease domain-containing protein n=1 Tax=Dyella silvatica TaxID=2992128 RepID=UPI00224DDC10|nr:ribonuclease domain-containing protein [Dyella silvatica]
MRAIRPLLFLLLVLAAGWLFTRHSPGPAPHAAGTSASSAALPGQPATATTGNQALPGFLPSEARDTLALIARGGPFAHRQDGAVFGNREGRLPQQPDGYYHEYTVETPNLDYRGARRIITGGTPPVVYYYTEDHYRSFRSFQVPR